MGRSVSYPSGAIVAFTLLEVDDEGDWDFEYEWLRADLSERAAKAFPSAVRTGSSGAMRSLTSVSRSTAVSLPYGSLNAMTGPIGTLNGVAPGVPGRSIGFAKSRPASTRCSATTIASDICRTARAFTASVPPETGPVEAAFA